MKIKLTKKNKHSKIERDILVAGATKITDEKFKEQMKNADTIIMGPHVQNQLKKIGLTPEKLMDLMLNTKPIKPSRED